MWSGNAKRGIPEARTSGDAPAARAKSAVFLCQQLKRPWGAQMTLPSSSRIGLMCEIVRFVIVMLIVRVIWVPPFWLFYSSFIILPGAGRCQENFELFPRERSIFCKDIAKFRQWFWKREAQDWNEMHKIDNLNLPHLPYSGVNSPASRRTYWQYYSRDRVYVPIWVPGVEKSKSMIAGRWENL